MIMVYKEKVFKPYIDIKHRMVVKKNRIFKKNAYKLPRYQEQIQLAYGIDN